MAKKGVKRTTKKKSKSRTEKFVRLTILFGIIGLIILCACVLYLLKKHPNIKINRQENPIVGIDISKHNGNVDFMQLAADSISFVYIKATEGNDYIDPYFETNYAKAKEAGLKIGAYHFFRMSKNGTVQAYNFMKSVKGKDFDLPLVIDVEEWGNDLLVDHEDAVKRLVTMVNCLKNGNYKVMIYTNKDGYKKFVKKHLPNELLWICSFNEPKKVIAFNWTILQYSHWGVVNGIDGDVDLDVFNGDRLAWERWLQSL